MGVLNYAIHALTWLFLFVTFLSGALTRSRALAYLLAAAAIMAVGIMLWQASLCWWVKQLLPTTACPGT